MVIYFIFATLSIIGLSLGFIRRGDGIVILPLKMLWLVVVLTPSLRVGYSSETKEFGKDEVNFTVVDLQYSRIVVIPSEGSLKKYNITEPMIIEFDLPQEITKIDSTNFNFTLSIDYNMWGGEIYRGLSLNFLD